jgi:hypothetical protein
MKTSFQSAQVLTANTAIFFAEPNHYGVRLVYDLSGHSLCLSVVHFLRKPPKARSARI